MSRLESKICPSVEAGASHRRKLRRAALAGTAGLFVAVASTGAWASPSSCTTAVQTQSYSSDPQETAIERQLRADALAFVSTGGDAVAQNLLQEELVKQGGEVVLQLADIAGAAFGMPGVGSILGAYSDMFAGLFGGGGGGGGTAAAIAQLDNRTSCLEANAKDLTNAIAGLARAQASTQNMGRATALTAKLAALKQLELDATEFNRHDAAWKQKFFLNLFQLSEEFLPPVTGFNIWGWSNIKVKAGTSANGFAPIVELDKEHDRLELAIEPYLRTLALVARFRHDAGRSDAYFQTVLEKHKAFLVGDPLEVNRYRIKWLNGYNFSLLDRFFPVTCRTNDVEVSCTGNGIPKSAALKSATPASYTSNATPDFVELQLKEQIYSEWGPAPRAILAAAKALGVGLTGEIAPPQVVDSFDGNATPIAAKVIYAVDAQGNMRKFRHVIDKVDTRQTAGLDPKILGMKVGAPISIASVPSADSDEQPDMSKTAPGSSAPSPFIIPPKVIGTIGKQSPASTEGPGQIKVLEKSAPALGFEIRNRLREEDPVRGDWSSYVDILPAQLTGSGQIVYGEQQDGSTRWVQLGMDYSSKVGSAGSDWQNKKVVFSTGEGVLYGLDEQGQLIWYRNSNILNGYTQAANWQKRPVGVGWGEFTRLFSPGKGVIYAVKPDGSLWWYNHHGYLSGAPHTEPGAWSEGKQVGTGWAQFTALVAAPEGYIYAVNRNGELLFYQHHGWKDGTASWDGPIKLADGWDKYRLIFASMGGEQEDGTGGVIVK